MSHDPNNKECKKGEYAICTSAGLKRFSKSCTCPTDDIEGEKRKFTDQYWEATRGRNDRRNADIRSLLAAATEDAYREGAIDTARYCYWVGAVEKAKQEEREFQTTSVRIGMLRQWLNEDRITDPKKMVTNEDLKHWLFDNKEEA